MTQNDYKNDLYKKEQLIKEAADNIKSKRVCRSKDVNDQKEQI